MERRTVSLQIAGQTYKVVSTAPDTELRHLAGVVTEKVESVSPRGRPAPPQAMLLAAMSLAHELEEERARRAALERKTRDLLRRVLMRIDDALDPDDGDAMPAGEQ